MNSFIRLLVPCLLLVNLAQAKEEKRVTPVVRPAAGQGVAMMRVIANRGLSAVNSKWEKLDVRHLGSGKEFEIDDAYGVGHHPIFVAALPAGEYEAVRVRVGDAEWQSLAEYGYANFEPRAWRFKVEAARLTQLGTLFFIQPFRDRGGGPVVYGRRSTSLDFLWIQTADPDLAKRGAHLLEAALAKPASQPLGWSAVPADAAPERLAAFKRSTLQLAGGSPAADGGNLFGEHFGQIAWRRDNARWVWEDTGTGESILCVADGPDGTRYAAAESSVLLRRDIENGWHTIAVPLEDATPRLLRVFDDGSLLTIWEQFRKNTALRYRAGADPAWTVEWEMPAPKGKVTKSMGYSEADQGARGVVYSTALFGITGLRTKDLAVFDVANGRWLHRQPEVKGTVAMMPDGSLYSMTGGQSNQVFQVSNDGGMSWEARSVGTFALGQPRFRTAALGYSIAVSRSVPGIVTQPGTLWRTSDGGRGWQPVIELPVTTNRMHLVADNKILLGTEDGRVFTCADDGSRCVQERDANAGN